jgi:hypothetical protein
LAREAQKRRISWALVISLGLHGLLLLWVALRPHPPPPPPSHDAIQVTINEVVVPPPKPKPEVLPAPKPAPKPPPKIATAQPQKKPNERPPSEQIVQAPPSASPNPQGGPQGNAVRSPDAPRTMTLVPGSDFPVAAAGEPEGPHGHTVVNGPGEEPDAVAMNEYTSEKLSRRVGAMTQGMASRARIGAGVVDPYFMHARSSLEGDMSSGDVPLPSGSVGREAVKGYLGTMEKFGKTGNPLGAGELKEWDNYSLGRGDTQGMALQGKDPAWAGSMHQAEQSMAAQVATQKVLDHAILSAELELVQEPGGGIADSHIVKSSGYKSFDEYILHHARKVFLKLDDPPDKGHGLSAAGWRSVWRFSYFPPSFAERRGQRVRVELLSVEPGQGSGNPLEHVDPE